MVSPTPGVTGAKVTTPTVTAIPGDGVISKLEFVAVTVTSPTETVSTSLISPPARTTVTTTSAAGKTPKSVTAEAVPAVATTSSYPSVRPLPGANANIPQFYFPLGEPAPGTADLDDTVMKKVHDEFEKIEDGKAGRNTLGPIVKVCWPFHVIMPCRT